MQCIIQYAVFVYTYLPKNPQQTLYSLNYSKSLQLNVKNIYKAQVKYNEVPQGVS